MHARPNSLLQTQGTETSALENGNRESEVNNEHEADVGSGTVQESNAEDDNTVQKEDLHDATPQSPLSEYEQLAVVLMGNIAYSLENLQDLHSFAPLQSQNLQIFASNFYKNR